MAPNATIFKVNLSVADMTRHYYQEHTLTVARHPSETDVRMMVRIAVFALNAHEHLKFGKSMSSADEPDISLTDLTGQIEHWIDLGQPTEKRIRQACGKARDVSIYSYQPGAAVHWFAEIKDKVQRFDRLKIIQLDIEDQKAVERIPERTMNLTCTIEENQLMLSNSSESVTINLKVLKNSRDQ